MDFAYWIGAFCALAALRHARFSVNVCRDELGTHVEIDWRNRRLGELRAERPPDEEHRAERPTRFGGRRKRPPR